MFLLILMICPARADGAPPRLPALEVIIPSNLKPGCKSRPI
jgi:hypothetical protein